MSNSSQDQNSLDNLLNDTIIISGGTGISSDMISVTTSDYFNSDMSTITLTGAVASQPVYTIGSTTSSYSINTDTITFNWGDAQEWVDSFPDWNRVQDMCKKYPGLEIALRNFKTVYTLVKDDYDNPKDKK